MTANELRQLRNELYNGVRARRIVGENGNEAIYSTVGSKQRPESPEGR